MNTLQGSLLFYLHQINGNCHCDNTRIATVEQGTLETSSCFCLHKRLQRLLRMYDSSSRVDPFQRGRLQPLPLASTVLRGKGALKNEGRALEDEMMLHMAQNKRTVRRTEGETENWVWFYKLIIRHRGKPFMSEDFMVHGLKEQWQEIKLQLLRLTFLHAHVHAVTHLKFDQPFSG